MFNPQGWRSPFSAELTPLQGLPRFTETDLLACERPDVVRRSSNPHLHELFHQGYTVLPGAVPASVCDRLAALIDPATAIENPHDVWVEYDDPEQGRIYGVPLSQSVVERSQCRYRGMDLYRNQEAAIEACYAPALRELLVAALNSEVLVADSEGPFLVPELDHSTMYKLEFSDLESLSNVSDHETAGESRDQPDSMIEAGHVIDGDILNPSDFRIINPHYDMHEEIHPLPYAASHSEEEFLTAPPSLLGSRDSLIARNPECTCFRDVQSEEKQKDTQNINWMVEKIEKLLKSDRVISSNVKHIRNCINQLTGPGDLPNVGF